MKWFSKQEKKRAAYDAERLTPVIRSSICTGEKTAGFKDLQTGQFHDVMLIRSEKDLEDFRDQYGITGEMETIY